MVPNLMTGTRAMETEYDVRFREWGEAYEDFEADDVRDLIVRAGERLAAVCLDEEAVDTTMKRLHEALGLPELPTDHEGDRSWRTLWKKTSSGDLLDLPLAQRLTSLNAYAYFGLSPARDGQTCTTDDVRCLIESVKTAVSSESVDRSSLAELDRTLLAAEGRLALDESNTITPDQLAALARIGLKSIRNALAPSSGSGLETKDGAVTAASALQWLNARGTFKTSIWREASIAPAKSSSESIEGEIIWVPFASDGTEFDPKTCLRAGNYTIGPKGSEERFADYREALDRLARMRSAPYWRRPNTVGNWGIVAAVGFRPHTAQELGLSSEMGGDQ